MVVMGVKHAIFNDDNQTCVVDCVLDFERRFGICFIYNMLQLKLDSEFKKSF